MEEEKYEYMSMKKQSSIRYQLFIVACINIGQIVVGYSVGWSAPIIPKLGDVETSPLPEVITDLQASWIGSLLYVGSIVGPYITGYFSNLIGRKICIVSGGLLNIVAYVLVTQTRNISMIYALRVISGLGMGITTVCNIVYVGEIASPHIRGILLTSTSIVGIFGTLLVYAVGPFVTYQETGYIALAICTIHVLAVIIVIPESPVYYAIKDEDIRVSVVLNKLGRSGDIDNVLNTFSQNKSKNKLKDWTEIFTVKSNIWSFFITFSLGALQQTSGVAAVLFFATTIFELAGSTIRPDLATIIIGATRLVSSIIAPTFVERVGRKILLLVSQAACAFSLTLLGTYFYFDKQDSGGWVESIGWLPLAALIMYFFSYEAGFGTIPNAIVGEMFRPNVRANGSALAITLTWVIGFGLTTGFTSIVAALGGDFVFWTFGASCVVAFLFTYFLVPETKGKTLNEIQEMMS